MPRRIDFRPTTEQIPGGSITLQAPREAYALQPRQALTNGPAPAPDPQLGEGQFQFDVNRGAEAGPEARFERLSRGLTPATTPEEKNIRRQFLINAASKHGVPPNELAKQMQVEGVEPTATPKAPEVIETGDGFYAFNEETGKYDTKVGGPKEKGGTPSEKIFHNPKTGDTEFIDIRNPQAVKEATVKGLKPGDSPKAEGLSFFDKEAIKKGMTQIPKLKQGAITAKSNISRLDKALDLVKAGAAGKGGQITSFITPYAELFGWETKGMTDAQAFQLLTKSIIGPMRLEIVGPGPVSEYEQQLMQSISGGGGTAPEAAHELLTFYKQKATEKVEGYNDSLEGLASINPKIKTLHKRIEFDGDAGTKTVPPPAPPADNTITVINPTTNESETWDTTTQQRIS